MPRHKEIHSSDHQPVQRPNIILPNEGAIDHEEIIVVQNDVLNKNYADALAFAEEPVTIRVAPPNEEHAPVVAEAWVNGLGPELLINEKWYRKPAIPIGVVCTTRRKYVEVLMRAKPDSVRTVHEENNVAQPHNEIRRIPRHANVLSIVQDKSPKGAEWARTILMEQ